MTTVPHFRVPFTVTNGFIATVEQDGDEDILCCVETILRTPVGSRIENPEFGVDDMTFAGPDQIEDEIQEAIREWEPRAESVPEAAITETIATVHVGVSNA